MDEWEYFIRCLAILSFGSDECVCSGEVYLWTRGSILYGVWQYYHLGVMSVSALERYICGREGVFYTMFGKIIINFSCCVDLPDRSLIIYK